MDDNTSSMPRSREEFEAYLASPKLLALLLRSVRPGPFIEAARAAGVPNEAIRDGMLAARDVLLHQQSDQKAAYKHIVDQISLMVMPAEAFGSGAAKMAVLGDKRLPIDDEGARHLRLADMQKAIPQESIVALLERLMEKAYPQILQKFYPRRYVDVGAYHSPRHAAIWLANVVAECLRYGFYSSPTAYRLMMPGLRYMIDKQMPMFFISPSLLEAILMTDFDDDIDWVNLKLPYEHGIFILPRGGYVHPTDGEVSMIMWSRTPAGSHWPPPTPGIPTLCIENTGMALLGLCPEKGIWYDSCLGAEKRPTLRLRNLFYRKPGEPLPQLRKSVPILDEDLTEQDVEFLEGMGVIAFGTLMAMNARPELIDKARIEKIIPAKKDRPRREFWFPNIIGQRYKLRREVPRISKEGTFEFQQGPGGTHSPRMHWRRGHFTHQPYGEGRRLRKVIWLEPMLIGAD